MDIKTRLASAVHDIKNRLQLLQPAAGNLLTHPDQEVQRQAERLNRGLNDIDRQLVSLLGLYRLEKSGPQISEIYIADLLEACADYLPSNMTVELDCDPNLVAFCDELMVRSMVGDAIHNACRYANGVIRLSACRERKGVLIRVEDDGAGLQEDDSNTGTGFGLALANEIASAHTRASEQGWVTLDESELGGVRFSCYLP